MIHNSKYTTHLEIYGRLTALIKNKPINPADVLEWSIQCETEFIESFDSLVPYLKVSLPVHGYMARVPYYCTRLLDVYDSNGNKPNYYNNGAYLVLNNDYTQKTIMVNFLGLAVDPETELPYIRKGHEEACVRHCMVNLYYQDFIDGKIHPNVYADMKQERNLQVQAARENYSDLDRQQLMEIAAIRLNMMPHIKYRSLHHNQIGG
jgi:hypothetical protein